MSTATATPSPETPRAAGGRFNFGNPGGPGNPFARQVAALRNEVIDFSTPEKIRNLTSRIYDLAMDGDLQAAKLFFSYALGKPAPVVDADRLDIEEWKLFRETAPMKEECAIMAAAGSPQTHLNQVRVIRPLVSAAMQQQITDFCEEKKKNVAEHAKPEEAKARAAEELLNRSGPESPDGLEARPWPSPIGKSEELPDGLEAKPWPSPNGKSEELPSALGNGAPPSPNGMRERKLRSKARRQAKKQADRQQTGVFIPSKT